MKYNITPNHITRLNTNEIFVFGSNLAGRHGRGAAKTALDKFGAVYGKGIGLFGKSYGIPTVSETVRRTLSIEEIRPFVKEFIEFVKDNPNLHFLITEIGCGLAGHSPKSIAPLFKDILTIEQNNYSLPRVFLDNIYNDTIIDGDSKEYVGGDVPD